MTTRIPMPVKQRAKQFAMFDALKGLTEAIAEKERQYDIQKDLSEDRIAEINEIITAINPGEVITVEYFCEYGMTYKSITGSVRKIDSFWKELQIGETTISFYEINNIIADKSPVAKAKPI